MIRLATPADVEQIQRVMEASIAALSRGFYDEQQIASATRYISVVDRQLIDDGTYFVIEEEGRVVACGGWSARAKLFSGPREQDAAEGWSTEAARIRAMFVDPACARRGLGRRILEASEEAAKRAGFTTFELMATLPGVPLYEACGYERVENAVIELPDGSRLGGVVMRKSVSASCGNS
jgi:GNAT superfamily N-acetyltransferase